MVLRDVEVNRTMILGLSVESERSPNRQTLHFRMDLCHKAFLLECDTIY